MNWLLSFGLMDIVIIWLTISVFVIATSWYAANRIMPSLWPKWWGRNIAAPFPRGFDLNSFLDNQQEETGFNRQSLFILTCIAQSKREAENFLKITQSVARETAQ